MLPLAYGAGKGNAAAAAAAVARALPLLLPAAIVVIVGFWYFGRLQLNTRCQASFTLLTKGTAARLYILMPLSAVCCYCFVLRSRPAFFLFFAIFCCYRCSANEHRTRRQIGSIFFGAFMNTKVAEKAIRDYIGSIQ